LDYDKAMWIKENLERYGLKVFVALAFTAMVPWRIPRRMPDGH